MVLVVELRTVVERCGRLAPEGLEGVDMIAGLRQTRPSASFSGTEVSLFGVTSTGGARTHEDLENGSGRDEKVTDCWPRLALAFGSAQLVFGSEI